ncbi:hypothetical protein CASFOL_009079 [Castilleja foliolosa]|uniref:Uncharacterized protein n=1 Tax=Castilleja foliolosa TaxID=1961234 RepID=A0ABD3E0V4_9LAMI
MVSNHEIKHSDKLWYVGRGGAALKEGWRILSTVFLSLLLPLSFLLLARLSVSNYYLSITDDKIIHPQFYPLLATFLILLVFSITIAALIYCSTGNNPVFEISKRRRFYAGWALLSLIQFCLGLVIMGTIEAEINSYTVGNLVLLRRLFLAFGLHETMIFWMKNVVRPVVDETIFGLSGEGFMGWIEKVVLAAAFGNLWWRRLRDEAEALVVLPWVAAELGMNVGAAGVLGWLLYYSTAAVGVVRVVKGFWWVVTWRFRYRRQVKAGKSVTGMDEC